MILVVASSPKELQGIHQFPQGKEGRRVLPNGNLIHAIAVGVGKLQSALGTYDAILQYHPKAVFGIGSCGAVSTDLGVGDIVIPSRVIQYDIDLRSFGLSRGDIFSGSGKKIGPLEPDQQLLSPKALPHWFEERRIWSYSSIGSADHFMQVSDRDNYSYVVDEMGIDAVDMESYAMVSAAQRLRTPIAIIRAVSDNWYGERAMSLPRFLADSSESIFRLIADYSEPREKSPTIL